MAQVKYALFHSINQKIATTRAAAWIYARILHHCDWVVLKLTGGRTTFTSIMTGLPMVIVSTIGAKSGLVRNIPLLAIPDDKDPDTVAVIGTNWGRQHLPAWYFNLKGHPQVSCSIRGKRSDYIAREIEGEEYKRFWERAATVYRGYPLYKQRVGERKIPIMALTKVKK